MHAELRDRLANLRRIGSTISARMATHLSAALATPGSVIARQPDPIRNSRTLG